MKEFDLADLKRDRNGVSVYLCLPASRMGLCNRWLRIFINQLLDAMEREKTAPVAPVLVCLDEFPVLGHMRQLEDAAGIQQLQLSRPDLRSAPLVPVPESIDVFDQHVARLRQPAVRDQRPGQHAAGWSSARQHRTRFTFSFLSQWDGIRSGPGR